MMDQNLFSRVESPETAARIAEQCEYYAEDCEDELVCDDEKSCCNCRYRRWTSTGFVCMKGATP